MDGSSLRDLIHFIFDLQVRIPEENQIFARSDLLHCGKLLAQLYLRSSTAHASGLKGQKSSPLVKAGSPLLFLEASGEEKMCIPFHSVRTSFQDVYGCDIEHFWLKSKSKNVRCWALQKNRYQNASARELRVSLLRLNAMRESLEVFLGALSGDALILTPRSMESERIQHYFNKVVQSCFRIPEGADSTDILALAHQTDSESISGDRVALLNKLEYELDIRRQVLIKAAEVLERREQLQRVSRTYIQEFAMGDIYKAGQVGAQGPHSTASNNTFNQIVNQLQSQMDLGMLADDLALLRKEMHNRAQTAEQQAEVGEIAKAELEASQGKYEKALEALAKTGRWSLSVGEKIGVGVAVAAIKAACGI